MDPLQHQPPNPTQFEMLHNVEELRSPPRPQPLPHPVPPRPLPDPPPGPARIEHVNPALLETAQALARILATRILLLIAVVTASLVWGWTVARPSELGIIAAGTYSVVGLWPLVFLYLKRG